MDEPTSLPEGTILDLVPDEGGDDLSAQDRRRLHSALDRSARQAVEEDSEDAETLLRRLRSDP